MGILDDISIFAAVIENGGFSHAAKHLGLSNGLISRRIAHLESELGVTLIQRTTRHIQLTTEGELFFQHAKRIQNELDTAIDLIHASAKKPKGTIRMSVPFYFGRQYLTPMIIKFLNYFNDIKIELDFSNNRHDLVKEQLDLVIRGAGFINEESLKASNLRMKLLIKDHIGLYASADYLLKYGNPKSVDDLTKHIIIGYIGGKKFLEEEKWKYQYKNKEGEILVTPTYKSNDIESNLIACTSGYGIGKFTGLVVKNSLRKQELISVLPQYDWGMHNIYAVYSNQKNLPQRTRLLLDFIYAHAQAIEK